MNGKPNPGQGKSRKALQYLARNYQLYILMALVMAYFVVFKYLPMYGLQMAFQDFNPIKGFRGSRWVGFDQFIKMFKGFYFMDSLRNTLVLSFYSLVAGFPFPSVFALLLNAVLQPRFKKTVQTIAYAPNFISTVVIVGMLKIFLSPSSGFINRIIEALDGFAAEWDKKYPMIAKSWRSRWNEVIPFSSFRRKSGRRCIRPTPLNRLISRSNYTKIITSSEKL
jgi:putative aldouronate transport system permease protein